jgi:hypothetical protein
MIRLLAALVTVAAISGTAVPAALAGPEPLAEGWQVLERHGGARFLPAHEQSWWPVRTGSTIPPGSVIATGSSGFLIIARAGASITVRPNSRVTLPDAATGDLVRQTTGDLRYRVTRAPERRFTVETPYLSLLVKGTVFDVAIGDRDAEVQVTEGRVRVSAARGQVVELSPGQGARIAAGAQADLEFRAAPESPFVAASRGAIAAAYTRDGSGRATDDRAASAGQEGQRSSRADPARADGDQAGGDTALRREDAARMMRVPGTAAAVDILDGAAAAALAPAGRRDSAGAGRDSGVEIGFSEGRMWIDTATAQIEDAAPRRDAPVRSAQLDLPPATGAPSSGAAAPPQPQAAGAAATADVAGDASTPPHASAAASDPAVQGSAGGWHRSDAIMWTILLAVATILWWRLRRSPDRRSAGHGADWRWPWQRSSLAPSSLSAGSASPGPASRRAVRNRT